MVHTLKPRSVSRSQRPVYREIEYAKKPIRNANKLSFPSSFWAFSIRAFSRIYEIEKKKKKKVSEERRDTKLQEEKKKKMVELDFFETISPSLSAAVPSTVCVRT